MQILSLGEHNGKGTCRCAGRKDGRGFYEQSNPGCPVTGHSFHMWSVAVSSDGKRIVSGGHDALVKVWDAATGAMVSS